MNKEGGNLAISIKIGGKVDICRYLKVTAYPSDSHFEGVHS
jgi:hypothetical protein